MTLWKTQESAPKNGKPFLLSLSKKIPPGIGYYSEIESSFCVEGITNRGTAVLYENAEFNWMELPLYDEIA